MKAELYMISPEQEFSLRTVQEASGAEAVVSPEQTIGDQWLRLWDRNWIRTWLRWDRNWLRWDRNWIRWEPPWEIDRILKGEKPGEIEPIIERLLLRREKDGFLAMDSMTSRVLKLDEQAGKLVQLVQDGMSPEDAAEQLGAKKGELEEFLAFLERHNISAKR